jgi:lipopolysaccharide export system permease protein
MKIHDLWLVKAFAKMGSLVVGASVLIFVVLDFVGNISIWLKKGWGVAGEYYLNFLPQIVYLIFPVVILLSVVLLVAQLARHLEIAALQAAGVPTLRILSPIIIMLVLVSVGLFYLTDRWLPDANHKRLEIVQPKTKKSKKVDRRKEKRDLVYISSEGYLFHAKNYYIHKKKGYKVSLILEKDDGVNRRCEAKTLKFIDSKALLLKVKCRDFNKEIGVPSERGFYTKSDSLWVKDLGIELDARDLASLRFTPEEMSMKQMERRIQGLLRSGGDIRPLQTNWHFRYAVAGMPLIVGIFGLALTHRRAHNGVAKSLGVGLLVAFSYYILLKIGMILGENGTVPPWLGAWFGNILLGVPGFMLFRRSLR